MNMSEDMAASDCPSEIRLCDRGRNLSLIFAGGNRATLSAALLRQASPSAEGNSASLDDGHEVAITGIEPIGNYAIALAFDDGHRSGIYSWQLLHQLASTR